MKNFNILTTLIICIVPMFGAETKPTIIPGQAAYANAVGEAEKVFNQSKLKAMEKFKKDLKKALFEETKSGDLDSANAISAEIKRLEDEQDKLLGMDDVNPKVALLGKWLVTRTDGHVGIWEFKDDGSVSQVGKNFFGKWSIEKDSMRIIWINDPSKWDTFNLPVGDKTTGDGWNIAKGGLSATRQK